VVLFVWNKLCVLCLRQIQQKRVMSRFPNYGTALKYLYGINSRLKAEGILAPNSNSLTNTKELYKLIGKPLDTIPTIHIGGTNGKVSNSFFDNFLLGDLLDRELPVTK
jgi:hypothetical protein